MTYSNGQDSSEEVDHVGNTRDRQGVRNEATFGDLQSMYADAERDVEILSQALSLAQTRFHILAGAMERLNEPQKPGAVQMSGRAVVYDAPQA